MRAFLWGLGLILLMLFSPLINTVRTAPRVPHERSECIGCASELLSPQTPQTCTSLPRERIDLSLSVTDLYELAPRAN